MRQVIERNFFIFMLLLSLNCIGCTSEHIPQAPKPAPVTKSDELERSSSPRISMGEGMPPLLSACLARESIAKAYRVSGTWNPYYLRGDFNGMGKPDYAVVVRNLETGELGIVICHSESDEVAVIAAGNDFQMGEGFFVRDLQLWGYWRVTDLASVEERPTAAEGILLGVPESATGVIHRVGKDYVWTGLSE